MHGHISYTTVTSSLQLYARARESVYHMISGMSIFYRKSRFDLLSFPVLFIVMQTCTIKRINGSSEQESVKETPPPPPRKPLRQIATINLRHCCRPLSTGR